MGQSDYDSKRSNSRGRTPQDYQYSDLKQSSETIAINSKIPTYSLRTSIPSGILIGLFSVVVSTVVTYQYFGNVQSSSIKAIVAQYEKEVSMKDAVLREMTAQNGQLCEIVKRTQDISSSLSRICDQLEPGDRWTKIEKSSFLSLCSKARLLDEQSNLEKCAPK